MEQLTPGLYAVARGRDRVQVGTGDHHTVIPRTPGTLRLLDRLGSGPTTLPTGDATVARLRQGGVVTAGPIPSGLARRLALESPGDWRGRLERRARSGVLVHGDLGVDPRPFLDDQGFAGPPTVALVLSRGEPDRAHVDPLTRRNLPHLVVSCTDGVVTLGPFVKPGETACVDCLALHSAGADPEHPDVQRRYRQAIADDPDPPPANGTLLTLALAWAVRDLAAWVDGDHPTLWSSTLRLRASGPPEVTTWLRHPECGCGWGLGAG